MSAIRLITFDVNNTIIRVMGGVGQNYAKVAALYDNKIDPAKLDKTFPQDFKRYSTKYPNFGVHDGLTANKWWNMVVKDSFIEAGSEDKHIDKIAQHLYMIFSSNQCWEIIPEAKSTLENLKKTGVKLGVISNFDERLELILTEMALLHYFQFVLPSTVVKSAKPNPEIFKMALKMADVKPSEALHIGDNVITDYGGAKSVGMNAVLISKPAKELPDHVNKSDVIYKLSDVVKYLH